MHITDFLPQYRELNTIFTNAINNGTVSYAEQCLITEFWNKYHDVKVFEKMVLDLVLDKDKSTYMLLLENIESEVKDNIRQYESAKESLDGINVMDICLEAVRKYDFPIKCQSKVVQKYWRELCSIEGELDSIGFREHTQQEEEQLWKQREEVKTPHDEEQKKLVSLYEEREKFQRESSNYIKNLFGSIYGLSLVFNKIINNYLAKGTRSDEKKQKVMKDGEEETKNLPQVSLTIEPDMIFRTKMYEKFLFLESKLIDNKYLDAELHWKSVHGNGKPDIKKLVIFLIALIDNNYFLPNKDPQIKTFFETRYNIAIGQNFERKRREPLTNEYKVVFYDYLF